MTHKNPVQTGCWHWRQAHRPWGGRFAHVCTGVSTHSHRFLSSTDRCYTNCFEAGPARGFATRMGEAFWCESKRLASLAARDEVSRKAWGIALVHGENGWYEWGWWKARKHLSLGGLRNTDQSLILMFYHVVWLNMTPDTVSEMFEVLLAP